MRRAIGSITNLASRRARHLENVVENRYKNVVSQRLMIGHDRATSLRSVWSMVSGMAQSSTTDDPASSMERKSEKVDISMPARQDLFRPPRERDCDREIAQLLNCPNGAALDSSTWLKAEACAQEAAEEGDFNLAYALLDRMAQDPHAPNEMNNEIVYLVVSQWVAAYDRYQKSPKGAFSHYMYSPVSVWRRMDNYLQRGIHLESRTLHRVLESTSMVKARKMNAPMLAESILERMMTLSKLQNPDIRPSFYTFNAVIAAWEAAETNSSGKSQLNLQEAPERGMMLLERLKALYAADGGDELMPDRTTYRRVMNLYAHKGDGDQVEALLQELYESYLEHGSRNLLPTTPMFSLVLYAWSKSKDPDAAERASTILEHMLEMERNNVFPGLKVTAFCFNIVMVCWSKQRTRKSAQKAQDLFDRMLELSATDPTKRPIPGSYAALITTWSFWDPKKSEEALWMWKREHNTGTCDMRMDNRLFSTLIAGWFYSKDPNSARRCDKLLKYGLEGNFGEAWQPNVADFNMTINAYCRQRTNAQDAERAEALLAEMKALAKSSQNFPGPSVSSYIPVIHNFTRLGKVEKADILLCEWFDSDNSRPDRDQDSYEMASKKKNLNTKTFNRVLKAWLSKAPVSPEAADRAEDLLLRMDDWGIRPNMASFQYALECRKRTRKEFRGLEKPEMGPRIERILALLDREYERGSLTADEASYLCTRRDWALLTV